MVSQKGKGASNIKVSRVNKGGCKSQGSNICTPVSNKATGVSSNISLNPTIQQKEGKNSYSRPQRIISENVKVLRQTENTNVVLVKLTHAKGDVIRKTSFVKTVDIDSKQCSKK